MDPQASSAAAHAYKLPIPRWEFITLAALYQLKKHGKCDGQCVARAVKELGIDPAKVSALYA